MTPTAIPHAYSIEAQARMHDFGRRIPQVGLLGASVTEASALSNSSGVEWLVVRRDEPGRYEFWRDDECVLRVDLTDRNCRLPDLLAIVGVVDDPALVELRTAWSEYLPGKRIAFREVADFGRDVVLSATLDSLSQALTTQRQSCARLVLDLSAYREEFDRLQHNFAALEAYVSATTSNLPQPIFEYPETAESVGLGDWAAETPASAEAAVLRQFLPVNSIGVVEFMIAISGSPGRGGTPLSVALRARETGEIIAHWSLDSETTAIGWIRLTLERAMDQIALGLEVEISSAPSGTGWRIGLGAPHPIEMMCARIEGAARSLDSPLAIRIFGALPGARPLATTDAALPNHAALPTEFAVPGSAYSTAFNASDGPARDQPLVLFDREGGFIQVHPHGPGEITIARLEIVAPAGAWRLTARIHLAHDEASPTDFAIFVCEKSLTPAGPEIATAEQSARPGFSGWRNLAAAQRDVVSVLLPDLSGGLLSVYLLTKQAGTADFAWARFSDLKLHLVPGVHRKSEAVVAVENSQVNDSRPAPQSSNRANMRDKNQHSPGL